MQYFESKVKKHYFIITPSELRQIMEGFHHVVVNSGVSDNYTESDPNDFLSNYNALYRRLGSGEKLVWKRDFLIASISTGITDHLENCFYKPTSKLSIPDFSEPCPYMETFCFFINNNQLSVSFSVTQFPENICGLCLSFPGYVTYKKAHKQQADGTIDSKELADFETYEVILSRIRKITKILKLEIKGNIRRTNVRVSNAAKTDLQNFHFIATNKIRVI